MYSTLGPYSSSIEVKMVNTEGEKTYAGCGIGGEGFSTVPGKKGAFPGGGQQLCGNRADPSERH